MAVELHGAGVFGAGDLPDVAVLQPVVRQLHLLSLHQLLAEQAVLITDGAAHGRNVQAGQAVQEAGRQSAQAAVAQRGFGLFGQDGLQVDAELPQGLGVVLLRTQVDQIAVEGAAGQKFDRQVIQPFALGIAPLLGDHPLLHDLVAHGGSDSLVELLRRGFLHGNAVIALQLAYNALFDGFHIERGSGHINPP